MGNWWLAASSRQNAHSCITSRAEFFGKTSSHRGDSAPLQLRFGTLHLLAFTKTKITFEREDFRPLMKFRKIGWAADGNWENCVRYFEGNWGIIVLCIILLVSCIFFNKCLYFFIIHGWIPSGWISYTFYKAELWGVFFLPSNVTGVPKPAITHLQEPILSTSFQLCIQLYQIGNLKFK